MACNANCCYKHLVIAVIVAIILGITVGIPIVLTSCHVIAYGVSVSVEDATLSTFSLATPVATTSAPTPTPTPTTAVAAVTYNVSMTVRVHNPSRLLAVEFAALLELRYSFDGAGFGALVWLAGDGETLTASCTKVCRLTMGAVNETVSGLGVDGVAAFARQSSVRVFEVDVVLAGRYYTVLGAKRSLAATCALKLPLAAPPASSSKKVKCV